MGKPACPKCQTPLIERSNFGHVAREGLIKTVQVPGKPAAAIWKCKRCGALIKMPMWWAAIMSIVFETLLSAGEELELLPLPEAVRSTAKPLKHDTSSAG